jgi:hypothetical protein
MVYNNVCKVFIIIYGFKAPSTKFSSTPSIIIKSIT